MRPALRVLAVLVVVGASLLSPVASSTPAQQAQAADARQFDPGNIISDAVFFDGRAMDAPAIQDFLRSKSPSSCAAAATDGSPCLEDFQLNTVDSAARRPLRRLPGRGSGERRADHRQGGGLLPDQPARDPGAAPEGDGLHHERQPDGQDVRPGRRLRLPGHRDRVVRSRLRGPAEAAVQLGQAVPEVRRLPRELQLPGRLQQHHPVGRPHAPAAPPWSTSRTRRRRGCTTTRPTGPTRRR